MFVGVSNILETQSNSASVLCQSLKKFWTLNEEIKIIRNISVEAVRNQLSMT